jgi:integrase
VHVLPDKSAVAKPVHHAALPYAAVPGFLRVLQAHQGLAARALEFAILTAARTGEVVGAVWDEIDFENKVWVIPASRMKAGKEHRVPLSAAAIALLRALPTEINNPFVFVGVRAGTGLGPAALAVLLRRLGHTGFTVHGFRSSFSDWAHEQTAHANHTIETSLAHAVGGAVEKAYRRGDLFQKRRKLMDAWAQFLAAAPAAGTVVPLRKGAATT